MVSRDLSCVALKRLDVTVRVPLSRLPLSEVSLEHAAGLPAISLPGPTSARSLSVDGFPWTIDNHVCDMLWRAILLSESDAFMGYLGVALCMRTVYEVAFCRLKTVVQLSPLA